MSEDSRRKAEVGRMMKKSASQTLLPEDCTSQCQAQVRLHVNRAIGGNWVRCLKPKREGKRTCWWHRGVEPE